MRSQDFTPDKEYILYVGTNPVQKYRDEHAALADLKHLRTKFPDKFFAVKVKDCEEHRVAELIDPSLKDGKGFTKIKHDELGLTYTAWSRGDTDLDIEVKTPGGKIIAHALFRDNEHPDDLTSDDTWVDKEYRRMGVASRMYNWAQELGNTVLPSKFRSAAAKKFWKTRT